MESCIAKELRLFFSPVAIIFTDQKPENCLQFTEGWWGCVISMLSRAAEGKTAVFDRKTSGCLGGGVGLGFGNTYGKFPGGIEYFLSKGRGEGYLEGEAYKKTPELAKCFVDNLPMVEIPYTYVVFKPLAQVDPEKETPQLVTFYANADQISALVVLANYGRKNNDNVIVPFAGGCQTVCLLPYRESKREFPRAVIGITDIAESSLKDCDNLELSVLRSPVSGTVIKRYKNPGEVGVPGQPVAVVADLSNLYITANIEEVHLYKIKPGQKADVTIDSYPGVKLEGSVISIGDATVSTFSLLPPLNTGENFVKVVQRVPVRIGINNYEGVRLLPGMNAIVRIYIK
ncbi:MAG: DUF169 domain-containing protein [Bacillota bacterium]